MNNLNYNIFILHLQDFINLIFTQIKLIVPYWIIGILLGSILSTYGRKYIEKFAVKLKGNSKVLGKVSLAAVIGAISPITMHGMVPLVMVMETSGVPQYILVSFVITSVLINPNVFIFSLVLGMNVAILRVLTSVLSGIVGGLVVKIFFNNKKIFSFKEFIVKSNNGKDENLKKVLLNFKKSIRKTAPNLLLGIIITAIFDKYFPREVFDTVFSGNKGLSVLFAAGMGVPIYFCGGGTIPLLNVWLNSGMNLGSAIAFMITGPSTKVNNLTAIKNMVKAKVFYLYIIYSISFGVLCGFLINMILR